MGKIKLSGTNAAKPMKLRKYHDIVLYSIQGSKMCELARNYLTSQNQDFSIKFVDKDPKAMEEMKKVSDQIHTPVMVIDDRVILGYQPVLYDVALGIDSGE